MTDEPRADLREAKPKPATRIILPLVTTPFEVVLVFGQFYEGNLQPQLHTRIVTSPAYAKTLLELLRDSLRHTKRLSGRFERELRMSDYTVISAASATLKQILRQNITTSADPQLTGVEIYLLSPKEMEKAGHTIGISVWLYKVSRMAEMLNEPPERKVANQIIRTPLPVLLYYLVTPITDDPLSRHMLLGKVLQVFNDNAILRGTDLQGVLSGTTEQLRVNLEALSLEELSLVWDALSEPYQLSVTYLIQVVKIDSDHEPLMRVWWCKRSDLYADSERYLRSCLWA